MLYVAPKLFTHRWEFKNAKNYELVIDIPDNIKEILQAQDGQPVEVSK